MSIAQSSVRSDTPIGMLTKRMISLLPSLLPSTVPAKLAPAIIRLRVNWLMSKSLLLSPPKPAFFMICGPYIWMMLMPTNCCSAWSATTTNVFHL